MANTIQLYLNIAYLAIINSLFFTYYIDRAVARDSVKLGHDCRQV